MKKILKWVAVALAFSLFYMERVQAQQQPKLVSKAGVEPAAFIVVLKDGTVDKWLFADKPVVTFADTLMLIKSDKAETSYLLGEIQNSYSSDSPEAGIEDKQTTPDFTFRYTDPEHIEISGVKTVSVHNVAGKLMRTAKADYAGQIILSLQGLPTGVYLLVTDTHKSVKVFVK